MPRLWNLRVYRQDKFLSLRDLAEKAGVARRQIVELEAGRASPQPRTVRKLAAALGVHPRALVGSPPPDDVELMGASEELEPVGWPNELDDYDRMMREAMRLLDGP